MEIRQFEQLPKDILEGIQVVHRHVFEGDSLKEEKLSNLEGFLAFVAIKDETVVGFKLGYEMEDGVFYSWLGGVHPSYQKRGIASKLMEKQHEECKKRGYSKVRTYGRNAKRAMLILNLKHGFDIVGTFIDDKGWHKIIFEKEL